MAINKRIVLGSGKLYYEPVTASTDTTDFTSTAFLEGIENDDHLLGLIKGGATLSYTPEFYTAEDDFGIAVKKMITSEEVTLESGIMTWNADTLKALVATGREQNMDGKRVLKVGGAANYDDAKYILHFVHTDASFGKIRITIIGSNESGFEMAFAKDDETVIDATFTAFPQDDDGTLIVYQEDADVKAPVSGQEN